MNPPPPKADAQGQGGQAQASQPLLPPQVGLLIFGLYFSSKILLIKVHLLVKPEQLVKNT